MIVRPTGHVRVYATLNALYNPIHRGPTRKYASMIPKIIDATQKFMKYDPKQKVVFQVFREKNVCGQYSLMDRTIYIDPSKRNDPKKFLLDICHELVHAEQHYTGKIFFDAHDCRVVWNGRMYSSITYYTDEYKHLPWEVEAYDRQGKIAEKLSWILS